MKKKLQPFASFKFQALHFLMCIYQKLSCRSFFFTFPLRY